MPESAARESDEAVSDELVAGVPAPVRAALGSVGRPLDRSARAWLEPAFGHDFSRVRIHTDAPASASARALHALGYTVGDHIVFGAGRYAPHTVPGRVLLAHELAHVVQQRGAPEIGGLQVSAPDAALEREAGQAALRVGHGAAPGSISAARQVSIQRADEQELTFLDGTVVNAIGSAVMGDTAWKFFREIARGFAGGVRGELAEGKGAELQTKLVSMIKNPVAFGKFYGGYIWGLVQGLVSPITDLWHLITFAVELNAKAIDWIVQGMRAPGPTAAKAIALVQSAARLNQRINDAMWGFLKDPVQGVKQVAGFLDAMMAAALGKAREAGHSLASGIFAVLRDEPFPMGQSIGKLVGTVLVQVLMLVFSESIGNALSAAGRMLAEAGEWIAAKIAKLVEFVKGAATGMMQMLRSLKGTALKFIEGLVAEAADFIARVLKFFELPEVESGLAAAGDAPPGALLSQAAKPPGPPPVRTTGTTVEELTGGRKASGGRGSGTKRVDPYERKVDDPLQKGLAPVRQEYVDAIKRRGSFPKDAEIKTVRIERTEAGRAQSAAVTPEESLVGMDIELDVTLGKSGRASGMNFKPDGMRYLTERQYVFFEHKEVMTVWESRTSRNRLPGGNSRSCSSGTRTST